MMLGIRSEEHTSELQSQSNLVCRLLLEKKKNRLLYHRPPARSGGYAPRAGAAVQAGAHYALRARFCRRRCVAPCASEGWRHVATRAHASDTTRVDRSVRGAMCAV